MIFRMSRDDKDLCDHYGIIFNSSHYAPQRHKFTVLKNLNNILDFLIEKGIKNIVFITELVKSLYILKIIFISDFLSLQKNNFYNKT